MESSQVFTVLLNLLVVAVLVLIIIWLLYSLYYMNNNEKTEKVFLFFRKPRNGNKKQRCPCGGHDPKSCRCKH